MVTNLLRSLRRKHRKYPIKRDQSGKSARSRAFALFDKGFRPAAVAPVVGISCKTACKYFQDWKKQPMALELKYRILRDTLKNPSDSSARYIRILSDKLGMTEEEVIERLQKPWGLKRLLTGKWPNYAEEARASKDKARLEAGLRLVDFVDLCGMPPDELTTKVKYLIEEALQKRSSDPNRVANWLSQAPEP